MITLKKHVAALGSVVVALAVITPSFVSAHPHFENAGPNLLYEERGKPKLSRYYEVRPGRYTKLSEVPSVTYSPAVKIRQPVVQTNRLSTVQPVRSLRTTPRYGRTQYQVLPARQRPDTCVHTVNRKGSTRRFSDSYSRLRGHLNYDYSPRLFELETRGYGRTTQDAIWNGQRWVRSYRGY